MVGAVEEAVQVPVVEVLEVVLLGPPLKLGFPFCSCSIHPFPLQNSFPLCSSWLSPWPISLLGSSY